MSAAALVFGIALLVVFVGTLIADHIEARRDWREWREEHPAPDESDPWRP